MTTKPGENDAQEYYEDELYETGGTQWFSLLVVFLAIGGFVWLAYYAYQTGNDMDEPESLPVIEADKTPYSREPENPGGLEVPHRDKSVYSVISGENEQGNTREVARLRPEPEAPIEKPVAETPVRETPLVSLEDASQVLAERHAAEADQVERNAEKPVETLMESKTLAEEQAAAVASAVNELADGGALQAASASKAAEDTTEEAGETAAKQLESVQVAEVPVAAAKAPKKTEKATTQVLESKAPASGNAYMARPAGTRTRVQLGAYGSRGEAESAWKKISGNHGALVRGIPYAVERADLGAKGVFHRLKLGPLPSKEAAADLCSALGKKGQGCFVTN